MSDIYYLLTLPINRWKVSLALFLGNLFILGLYYLGFGTFSIKLFGVFFVPIYLAFAAISLSLSSILYNAKSSKKIIVSLLVSAWYISPIFHFYFSPTAIFFVNYYGYVLVGFLLFSLVLAFRSLNKLHYVVFTLEEKGTIRDIINFSGRKPFTSVFLKALLTSETFRVRIRTYQLLILSSVIAIILYYLSNLSFTLFTFIPLSIIISFSVTIIMSIFAFFNAVITFTFEPIWLSMGILKPREYAFYYFLGNALKLFFIFLPINLVLLINEKTFGVGIFNLIVPELSYIFIASLYARFNSRQIRSENDVLLLPSLSQLFIALLYSILIFVMIIPLSLWLVSHSFLPILIAIFSFVVIDVPFLSSNEYWEEVVEKIVENGFV
uniref:Uncharacterized protein n=2 Tax=Acidianus TaxID=12914 RepID=A0A2U9IJC5_9CREN